MGTGRPGWPCVCVGPELTHHTPHHLPFNTRDREQAQRARGGVHGGRSSSSRGRGVGVICPFVVISVGRSFGRSARPYRFGSSRSTSSRSPLRPSTFAAPHLFMPAPHSGATDPRTIHPSQHKHTDKPKPRHHGSDAGAHGQDAAPTHHPRPDHGGGGDGQRGGRRRQSPAQVRMALIGLDLRRCIGRSGGWRVVGDGWVCSQSDDLHIPFHTPTNPTQTATPTSWPTS